MTTQVDFDQPPVYDMVLNPKTLGYSDIWVGYWSYFYQTLISYVTQNGFFLPNLSQVEINNLQVQNLMNGQLLYNLTVDAPQFWQASSQSWRTISFT
jgi:hypothetical protein